MSSHALTKPRKSQSKFIDPTFLYILASKKMSAFDNVSKIQKEICRYNRKKNLTICQPQARYLTGFLKVPKG